METHLKTRISTPLGIFILLIFIILLSTVLYISNRAQQEDYERRSFAQESTSSSPQVSFSFTTAGDYANDRGSTSAFTNVIKGIGAAGANFHLGLGDYIYSNDLSQIPLWCQHIKNKINEGAGRPVGDPFGETFPFELVAGNHDSGESNSDIITISNSLRNCLPHRINNITQGQQINGSAYALEYYFDYPNTTTPLARIIMISPDLWGWNYLRNDSHYNFVRNAILSARSTGIQWIVLGYHKNCISNGVKSCEISQDIFNLAAGKDLDPTANYPTQVGHGPAIDLILQGHEHSYHRSKQLNTNSTTCTGIQIGGYDQDCVRNHGPQNFTKNQGGILAIIGTGGISLRSISGSSDSEAQYFNSWMGTNETYPTPNQGATWGLLKVTINESQLIGQFLNRAGGTFTDGFTITSSVTGTPTPTHTPTPVITNSPTPTPTIHPGMSDFNNDGVVTGADFSYVRNQLGLTCAQVPQPPLPTPSVPCGDVNCDGLITVTDFSFVRTYFGQSVPPAPACGVIPSSTPSPTGTPGPLTTTADSYVNEESQGSNYGTLLNLISDGQSPRATMYMKFDLSSYAGRTLTAVRLRVTTTTEANAGSPGTQSVKTVADSTWGETTLNFTNRPLPSSTVIGTLSGSVPNTTYDITLTPSAIQPFAGGLITLTMDQTSSDGFLINSREVSTSTIRPQLVVTAN